MVPRSTILSWTRQRAQQLNWHGSFGERRAGFSQPFREVDEPRALKAALSID
jgi:hypothetical protein